MLLQITYDVKVSFVFLHQKPVHNVNKYKMKVYKDESAEMITLKKPLLHNYLIKTKVDNILLFRWAYVDY